MPSGLLNIEHVFSGGWEPDSGTTSYVEIDQHGRCEIPWLMEAETLEFELDGSPHKMGGADLLFDTPIASAWDIRGLYDFWLQNAAGSATQARFVHAAGNIYMDNGDGVFAVVFFGLSPDCIPDYSPFEGKLIISQTGSDVPKVSDTVTHADLPAGTPNFAFSTAHKLRQWAAGVDAAPSHLFYSEYEDPEDWTGGGSGDIAISPGDGDRITAIASFNNELLVFKGLNKGSIHRLTGSAPVGEADPFALKPFIASGLGAVNQRTVFRFGNDLGFMWSDGSVHSINTTERYGDFRETALSRPLNKYLRTRINSSALVSSCAAVQDSLGVARFSVPIDSATRNNMLLSMDFRFNPPRWSHSAVLGPLAQCLAMVRDTSTSYVPRMMSGGRGLVHMFDSPTKRIARWLGLVPEMDSSLITPMLSYQNAPKMSTLCYVGVRLVPKRAGNVTVAWVRDGKTEQSTTVDHWTGDVLAPAAFGASPFVLGSSSLLGDRSIAQIADTVEGGEFQQIQYRVDSAGANQDIHIQAILSSIKPGATSMEDLT